MIERDLNPINPSALDQRIRIALVVPHPVQRTRLIHMARVDRELDIVGVTADGEELMRICPHVRPHVVVIDPLGAEMDGQALTGLIQGQWPWIQVLVMDGGLGAHEPASGDGMGAAGLSSQESRDRNLGVKIRTLFAQKNGTPAWNTAGPPLRAFRDEALSQREWEVWQALKMGLSDIQLAERLGVNELTARLHVRNVMDHMGLSSRQDIVAEPPDRARSRKARDRLPVPETRELAAQAHPAFRDLPSRRVMRA